MNLSAWDVIWPYDPAAKPPKPKLWVCVESHQLFFLRINASFREGAVLVEKRMHRFLEIDSCLHCHGESIYTSEAQLENLLNRQAVPRGWGIVGSIPPEVREAAIEAIDESPLLAPATKNGILAALRRS